MTDVVDPRTLSNVIPNVTLGQMIDPAWGNAVANAINNLRASGTDADRLAMTGVQPGQGFWDAANKRLWMHDGAAWQIIAEPVQNAAGLAVTGTGWALGAGTIVVKYQRRYGQVTYWGTITFGAGMTGGTGGLGINGLPTAIAGPAFGTARMTDAGVNNYLGLCFASGANSIGFQIITAGAKGQLAAPTSSDPFASWGVNDFVEFTLTAQMTGAT